MAVQKGKFLRFVRLRFQDYRIFRGFNEFRFKYDETIIVGGSATGKTTIAESLENLRPCVALRTDSDRGIVYQYKELIVPKPENVMEFIEKWQKLPQVKAKARTNFETILSLKPWKIKLHQNLDLHLMAMGERHALYYAFIFAVRAVLGLDVPVVLDDPYSCLDPELQQGLRNFLKGQSGQKILLRGNHWLEGEEHADYVLSSSKI